MMIQCKLQPHPKDGSQLIWKLRNGSFESIFAKEKYFWGAKYNFGFSRHSDRRPQAFTGVHGRSRQFPPLSTGARQYLDGLAQNRFLSLFSVCCLVVLETDWKLASYQNCLRIDEKKGKWSVWCKWIDNSMRFCCRWGVMHGSMEQGWVMFVSSFHADW